MNRLFLGRSWLLRLLRAATLPATLGPAIVNTGVSGCRRVARA